MGRSKPPIRASAPPRVKSTADIRENSSLKMNTFIKNAKQNKSDAAKINTMQMDPPGGRRRMGRATKVHTPESESSLSPTDMDSCNDGGNVGGSGAGVVNAASSECRRSSRKKTIKFDVRDLLNKNRKSHKIQIEARIDSNAPKTGAGPASREELDSKQKTFIEKSAIFRRYSLSENKPPPRPPPPVALIKTIQQCVGELEQLPLDRDIDLAVISPIARRLSRTQEILTASMMKPKQVNSLIVTKLENATTSTPAATRKGGRQKMTAMQDAPTSAQLKRRGRPRKNQTTGLSESTAESSNDSSDISEIAIISSPIVGRDSLDGEAKLDKDNEPLRREVSVSPASSTKCVHLRETPGCASPDGEAKLDKDNEPFTREISVSPASSTKAIDLREKIDPSAVTMSPSELMFVGAEEEVFTQDLSSDGSTAYLRSPVKEKSNDEISLFGRSDSTETNSSDDSEHRRKKIRVSVKRVALPSALREHVDLMLKGSKPPSEVIEVLSSNDEDSLQGPKEANKSSQDISETIQTRGSNRRLMGKAVIVVDGENSNSTTIGSIVEISSDSAATPVKELLATRIETASPQLRSTPTRWVRNCRRQATADFVEEETVQCGPIASADVPARKDVQEQVSNPPTVPPVVESNVSTILPKSSPQSSVQKQQREVPSLQTQTQGPESEMQKEKLAATKTADGREEPKAAANEKNSPAINAVGSLSPRTRSQKEVHIESIEIVRSEDKQSDGPRKPPATRSISLRRRKDAGDQKETEPASPIKQPDAEECNAAASDKDEGPGVSASAVTATESKQKSPESGPKPDSQTIQSDANKADSTCTITAAMASTQRPACKGQKPRLSDEKGLALAEEEIKDKVNVKLKPSDVEVGDKELTESKSSPTQQTNSSRSDPPESTQQVTVEEVPKKDSSPVTRKTKKAAKYLARVISTDQSSSSSEQSESPKSHNKKTPADGDKSKEDTSSICSESSSVESSSSTSSSSSATATSKSSSTSATSSTSSQSSTSSSTSSSSLSDVHGRATRSRRSLQLVLDADAGLQKSPKSSKAAGSEELFPGPDSENSEYSLRRGKVRPAADVSPKERAKLLHRRRSMRTNRFLLDEESNETSSESSEASSSIRMTRTARSKVRSEVTSPVKVTSRSVECVRGAKVAVVDSSIKAESKNSASPPERQKSAENVAKDGLKVAEDPTSRSKKKPGRFVPLKDNSFSCATMRETRARRKTISSASELEELLDRRMSRDAVQKKQVKVNKSDPLEEMTRNSKGKLDESKTKAGGHKKVDERALRRVSASAGDAKSPEVKKSEVNDKDAGTSEDQSPKRNKQAESKTSDTDIENGSRKYIKIAFALGSPKCKVAVKSIDKETLKLACGTKGNDAVALEMKESEAKLVVSTCAKPNFAENKTARIVGAACSGEKDLPTSKPTVAAAKIVNAEGKGKEETVKPTVASAKIVNAEAKGPIDKDVPTSKPTAAAAKIGNAEGKDELTIKPTAKELSPRAKKTHATENSASTKREEGSEPKAQNVDSVSKQDAIIRPRRTSAKVVNADGKGPISKDVPTSKPAAASAKVVNAEAKGPVNSDGLTSKPTVTSSTIVNAGEKDEPISKPTAKELSPRAKKTQATENSASTKREEGPEPKAQNVDSVSKQDAIIRPRRTSAKVVNADGKGPISKDVPTSKPAAASAKVVNAEAKGPVNSDGLTSKPTVASSTIVNAGEKDEPISKPTAKELSPRAKKTQATENSASTKREEGPEPKAQNVDSVSKQDAIIRPRRTSAKVVNADGKGPINKDVPTSKPAAASAKVVNAEAKGPVNSDGLTSKPTVTSSTIVNAGEKDEPISKPTAKELSPKSKKTQPTEVSTSAKKEKGAEQKAQNADSVSKQDATTKLEGIAKVSAEKVEKPASGMGVDEQLSKQNTRANSTGDQPIVHEVESAPASEAGKQEVTNDCSKQKPATICIAEEKEMHVISPPSSMSDSTPVSTVQADAALIPEPNLDNSSTKMPDNVEDSNLRNCTPNDDRVNEEKSENENSNKTQTPQDTDDTQSKTPRRNKKIAQQEPQTTTTDDEQKKKKGPLDDVNNEPSSVSNSDDSLKSDMSKADTKPAPCRQLDSSFINSLEKSLLKPTSAKKPPKKKEKPQATPATPKEKDDTKKCKKNQVDDQKAVESTASPKSKKKQKDLATKVEKKAEAEAPAKRKSVSKNKSVDGPKPLETSEPKMEVPEAKVTEVPQPAVVENPAPETAVDVQQAKEAATSSPPKPMKSKGETKFFPEEHQNEEKLNATSEACSADGVPKEKSLDLVPDPLKDIEKFIEDGVNLLKRGYKLDEGEEGAGNSEAGKPDDSTTPKKCKLDENSEDKKQTNTEDDSSNSNSEHSLLTSTPSSDVETPNGIRRSHRIKNNSKSAKCLVGRGLVRDRERFSMKDDEKTVYSIDDQKLDLAEVEAKNSQFLKDMEERLSNFRVIRENEYKCERVISKEAKRMLCDCFLTAEEEERGELGCGEDCLNRLLMIECGSDCTVKERCTNRRFTKFLYSPCRVFRTEKKGFGIMADIEILPGEFIMEYVGEVIDGDEFERRRNMYSQDKNKHYYFMALRSDAIIDATAKGNVSRFINHSCDPNAETQKWTVNGELRIGFFSRKSIMPGEEITFDYQYQRYGKEAQKCYCESTNCRGWIGEEPSSDEEEEEEEIDDEEEGETESEEEEEQEVVPMPAIPVISPPIMSEGEQVVSEVPVVDKDEETAEAVPVLTPVTVEEAIPPKETQVKKKKEKRRQLDRKEEKIKRRETKQFLEDPDIEDEVRFLVKCGLRNQADTLRLSRLIVRAKLLGTRLNLLQILRAGELACRRLFLDYHGLRLLHGWMSEVIDTRDTEKSMEIRMALLSVLECLPISNKTMLTDSKVYQTVRDWSNNKESHSPSEESPKDTTTTPSAPTSSPVRPEDSSTELQKLAAKLVSTWDSLPEVFRIPKRERIEQMKEHEREADRQYKGLAEDVSGSEDRRNRDRFIRNGPNSSRFKWSRSDKDKEREQRIGDRRRYVLNNNGPGKDCTDKTQSQVDSHLSKEQRRELFAAKVARDEAEKRLAEERREFDIKCRFFGLDPKRLRPENMPFCVNPSTGQWYSTDKKAISTPPSYAHVQVPVKPKSTNPDDYRIPLMDLPPLWKFAISPKGKVYYYHVKIRIPQWEPPIKILPLAGQKNTHVKASESDSSNAECADSSEDDIDIIKGLDPVKLQAYIEKKIDDRRLQRYTRLVEEKPISPRKEEDRIYNQLEVRKYKENKEKIRKRKEEIRRRRDTLAKLTTSIEANQPEPTDECDEIAVDAIPIQDYLISSDEDDKLKEECNNSPLIDKIVQGDKIVDELDALQCKRPLKRALPIREKYEHKKRKVDKNKESSKSTKRSKDGEGSSSSKYRKIREKFRCEIAGIIVHHLRPYRKETCFSGRILTEDDFNHLARKLTHFVMVKELKYCESIGQTLVVTESVKNKSREFIKKYMAKYGGVYVRPENDPEFKEIPFL